MSDASSTPVASVEHLSNAVVVDVHIRELMTRAELDAICREIDTAQTAAPSLPFILDLANVSFMGSLAMGTLVGLYKEFRNRGQRMIFVSLRPNVEQSLTVAHLHQVIEIARDVPTALQNVG